MTRAARDPRITPKAGDVLRLNGDELTIRMIGHGLIWTRYKGGRNGQPEDQEWVTNPAYWAKHYQYAEVLHVAE